MTTAIPLTLFLAQALGLYMILVGISGLARPQRWQAMMGELSASPALQMTMGVMVFALGLALIHVHCILTDPLAILVTLVGWIALVEGALLIAVPDPLLRIGRWAARHTRVWAIACVVLGILLGLAGLLGRANADLIV